MLKERLLSASLMILVVLGALFWFPPLAFTLLVGTIVWLGCWEWAQFAGFKGLARTVFSFVVGCVFVIGIVVNLDEIQAASVLGNLSSPLLVMACVWWLIALGLVATYPNSAKFWANSVVARLLFGFVTLVPYFIAVLALRFNNYYQDAYSGTYLLLYVFLLIWGADSGAYFFGRRFGKHKLAPKVSPGKSWEGAIGGIFCSAVIAVIFLQSTPDLIFGREIAAVPFILVSALTVAVSILGDLAESMLKRQAGLKDSSQLIPGHGGVLDRIDSLTAAVPVFALFFFFVL